MPFTKLGSFFSASSLTPPRSETEAGSNITKHAKESDTEDSDDDMEEEDDDEEEEEIPLDLEEIEAVSKKARQDEEIHTEHMQVPYYHR